MVEINGFSAWVTVDGVELPQYDVQFNLDAKQAICWIPSETNKQFTVCWRDPLGVVGTAGYLAVDGTPCGAKHMYSAAQRPFGRVDVVQKSSVATSTTTERPLAFARLELTDLDLYLDIPASPDLGDIRLDIFEVSIEGKTRFVQPGMPPDDQLLHERTKKAFGHRVKLGHEAACKEKRFVTIKKICHLCTFIFRYRPIDVLKANGIITVEGSSAKRRRQTPVESGVIDLTIDDLGERDTKRVKMEAINTAVKAEIKMEFIKTEIKTETEFNRGIKPELLEHLRTSREPCREVLDLT